MKMKNLQFDAYLPLPKMDGNLNAEMGATDVAQ